jgi:MFS family permease
VSSGTQGQPARRPGFLRHSAPPWLTCDLFFLFGARAIRSIALGYLGIVLPLYLAELGYKAAAMGLLFGISALAGAIMAALVGFLADRAGRKPFLVIISLMMAIGSPMFALTNNFAAMIAAAALGTIGFAGAPGLGGGWGPYYPAAQSLVAEQAEPHQRTSIFGALSFVGVIAGALGSLLAILPGLLNRMAHLPLVTSYRWLFFFSGVLGLAMALIVLPVRERPARARAKDPGDKLPNLHQAQKPAFGIARIFRLSPATWRLVIRFMITNATNGLAIGMLGPMVVYWFYRRYGATGGEIAQLYFVIGSLAAISYLLAAPITRRFGTVATIVVTRLVSSALLLVIPAMPTFALAALVYTLQMVANVLSVPIRQSYLMGVISPAERASAAGLANLPSQATRSLSSYFGGYLMQHLALSMPLELAGVLQALNAALYYFFFRNVPPPEEIISTTSDSAAAGD